MTLNDPVVVEAANALARDLMATETSYPELITAAHQRVLFQEPEVADATALLRLYNESLVYYHTSPAEAEELVGSTNAELAALTVVVNALFNLDEFISKA
jgi:phospholipase C